jgi:hypothetical protein
MKTKVLLSAAVLMLSLGVNQSAIAQDANQAASKDKVEAPAPASASTAPAVPKLKITWDCGACAQNDKVIALIEQSYADEAKANGMALSEADSAEVTIVEFRQRPPGARVMLGVFAGKDILGLRIRYQGKEYLVDDYFANAFSGMNALCESVAKKAYASLTGKPG